jgi:hypothetical protein
LAKTRFLAGELALLSDAQALVLIKKPGFLEKPGF